MNREDNLFGDVEEFVTDWLEPLLEESQPPADPSKPPPPPARFLARLDPPIAVPYEETVNPAEDIAAILFPNAVLHERVDRSVHVPGTSPDGVIHSYRLSSSKPVYSRLVHDIPFTHPRELLPILKILRQYAAASIVLGSCFLRDEVKRVVQDGDDDDDEEDDDVGDLESFMDDDELVPSSSSPPKLFVVDMSLSVLLPQLDLVMSLVFPMGSEIVHLEIEVGKNGEMRVEGKGVTGFNIGAFEKALRACEDIPLALEWASRQ